MYTLCGKQIAAAVYRVVPMESLTKRGSFAELLVNKVVLHHNKGKQISAIALVGLFDEAYAEFVSNKPVQDMEQWNRIFMLRGWEMMWAVRDLISPAWVVEDAIRILSCRVPKGAIPKRLVQENEPQPELLPA